MILYHELQVWAAYSPVKNSPKDAAAKAEGGGPSHSATTGELDVYQVNCRFVAHILGFLHTIVHGIFVRDVVLEGHSEQETMLKFLKLPIIAGCELLAQVLALTCVRVWQGTAAIGGQY